MVRCAQTELAFGLPCIDPRIFGRCVPSVLWRCGANVCDCTRFGRWNQWRFQWRGMGKNQSQRWLHPFGTIIFIRLVHRQRTANQIRYHQKTICHLLSSRVSADFLNVFCCSILNGCYRFEQSWTNFWRRSWLTNRQQLQHEYGLVFKFAAFIRWRHWRQLHQFVRRLPLHHQRLWSLHIGNRTQSTDQQIKTRSLPMNSNTPCSRAHFRFKFYSLNIFYYRQITELNKLHFIRK